ncbi:hypothetical protein ACROYT_G025000 [Oculina patagonica]
MSPSGSFALFAVLFFAFCYCDSIVKEDELELNGEAKIAGVEETDADWSEEENIKDTSELPEKEKNDYETTQDGTQQADRNSLIPTLPPPEVPWLDQEASCDSSAQEDELELKGEPNIAGIEETDADWGEDEDIEDADEFPEDTNEYETAQDE